MTTSCTSCHAGCFCTSSKMTLKSDTCQVFLITALTGIALSVGELNMVVLIGVVTDYNKVYGVMPGFLSYSSKMTT